ncbi:acyl carrier protein [Aquabacter spiritensis]|uniref:Acyl carrier protein n=1 Tax=Aquabacter spiritensis TaxID=933073 RepID=A0A4R3LTW3_9HYPH|nr:acyl carrier protein [Aquabacter spiritensis]TCT04020.1 acyl carrier protein [Aquabacter spiritensis]
MIAGQDPSGAGATEADWSPLEARVVALIRSEIEDKSAVLARGTTRDAVAIDSIDIVHVVFALEEQYGAVVDLKPGMKFDTVGDLVDALVSFIPEHRR